MANKVLSCFIDESGDFGEYDSHSPFYMVSIVLHEQSHSIQSQINGMEEYLSSLGYPHHALHAGPLIRRESVYENMLMEERKKLFNLLFNFTRKLPVHFICSKVKKAECPDADKLEAKLTKELTKELRRCEEYFRSFDQIIIYYDNGQKPVKRILNVIFNSLFSDVEVRKVSPADYKLFQVADLICTLELINEKTHSGAFSNTENEFFLSPREFKKEYWRKIDKMRL